MVAFQIMLSILQEYRDIHTLLFNGCFGITVIYHPWNLFCFHLLAGILYFCGEPRKKDPPNIQWEFQIDEKQKMRSFLIINFGRIIFCCWNSMFIGWNIFCDTGNQCCFCNFFYLHLKANAEIRQPIVNFYADQSFQGWYFIF